jgi:UDP-perosamine 4-acetyltransferase
LASKKVIIYGAGQLAALVAETLGHQDDVEVIAFADDDPGLVGQEVAGLRVLGGMAALAELRAEGVSGAIVSIGDNRIRGRVAANLTDMGFELVNAIDPTARVAASVRLGKGVIIATGAIVCANAQLGSNVYVGPGAIVSHDVSVGDNVLLSVGSILAGRTAVEQGAFIGAGATVVPARMGQRHRLRVGENAVVAAGSVVLADVPANAVVIGVPGRVVRFRQPDERQV